MTTVLEQKSTSARRGKRDVRVGTVISDKGDKTLRVRFDYVVRHSKYGKYFRRSTILAAHDEKNEARSGDLVEVAACRRISKTKCWRLTRIVERRGMEESTAD